jgi:hypothetical protein
MGSAANHPSNLIRWLQKEGVAIKGKIVLYSIFYLDFRKLTWRLWERIYPLRSQKVSQDGPIWYTAHGLQLISRHPEQASSLILSPRAFHSRTSTSIRDQLATCGTMILRIIEAQPEQFSTNHKGCNLSHRRHERHQ